MPSPSDDTAMDAHSATALTTAKRNLRYLYSPSTTSNAPTRRRTRALLRVLRSSLIFAFWRVVRYAKYVAIGSLVATIGAGAFGTFVSGAGFVLAPTGVLGTVGAAAVWGVGRFAVRRVRGRWEKRGYVVEEGDVEREEREERVERRVEGMPW